MKDRNCNLATRSRGFTLAEVAISALLVSLLFVAAVGVAGAANVAKYKSSERATGRLLGGALMAEILSQSYEQPGAAGSFGLDAGETARSNYNDVDDYDGYSETQLQNKDATALQNLTGWSRSVAVRRVNAADFSVAANNTETGLKRIAVTVKHNNVTICTRTALKSNAP